MPSNRPERREEARFRILRMLNDNPDMSTRDIAHAVGVSNGAAWYLLSALIEKCLVKAQKLFEVGPKGKICVHPDARRPRRKGAAHAQLP